MNIVFVIINSITIFLLFYYVFTYFLQLNRYEVLTTISVCGTRLLSITLIFVAIDILEVLIKLIILTKVMNIILSLLILCFRFVCLVVVFKIILKKNKLKFTHRVVRHASLCVIAYSTLIVLTLNLPIVLNLFILKFYIAYIIANSISIFIEYLIIKKYIYATKQKLKKYPNIIKIGITGSYGKTSTKFILTKLLQTKYIVKCTPNSYNTLMGVSKFILETNLNGVQILIIEMGAVRLKDITKLCNLVDPSIGILTSIGKQHLDTFHSCANIVKGKAELSNYILQHNGLMVFNCTNADCEKIYLELEKSKNSNKIIGVYDNSYNTDDKNYAKINYLYKIHNISQNGTLFSINELNTKMVAYLSTILLGESNVVNIAMSVAVARNLGVDFDSIANEVSRLNFVTNRMELRTGLSGARVIYDAYNSNEFSYQEMLKTVSRFNCNTKILITPGVVDLGRIQYDVNIKLAKLSFDVFDEVWVINSVNKYAFKDAESLTLNKCVVKYFSSLNKEIFDTVNQLSSGYLVVFENDLPDIYK